MREDDHFVAWSRQVVSNPELARIRRDTIAGVARDLDASGIMLQMLGDVTDNGQPSSSSHRANGREAVSAVGLLARIAAELAGVSGELLSGTHHYAGAALLRQIVEIEYLTWAFANSKRNAADWLNSTREDRMSIFRPSKLRTLSNGRFNHIDYQHHCEQGGHPVPGAVQLIGTASREAAQILLVDLLLHSWRIADNLARWIQQPDNCLSEVPDPLLAAKRMLEVWGEQDPYYSYICSIAPD